MLDSATIDGLKALRLHAMAAALADQQAQAGYAGLSFDERLGLLVDRELTDRASRRIERSLKTARLRAPAPSRTSTSATPAAWTAPTSWASPRPTGHNTAAPS